MSSIINILRLAALGTVSFFSVIILGVSAYLISLAEQAGAYYTVLVFTVAIATLTLLMFPALLIIGLVRKGALFNHIIVEVGVLGLFWVFWLATAAYTADQLLFLPSDCDSFVGENAVIAICHDLQAMHAFSWLNWLIPYPPQQSVIYAPQPQQPQMGYPPNIPGAPYSPVPTQSGYTPSQPPQVGYIPAPPPQQPQQYVGRGYPQV